MVGRYRRTRRESRVRDPVLTQYFYRFSLPCCRLHQFPLLFRLLVFLTGRLDTDRISKKVWPQHIYYEYKNLPASKTYFALNIQ